jgi:hypothetical protein
VAQVKQILDAAGWTGKRLSEHFGIGKAHISNIVAGRRRPKVLQTEIARLVHMRPEELWGEWVFSRARRYGGPGFDVGQRRPNGRRGQR